MTSHPLATLPGLNFGLCECGCGQQTNLAPNTDSRRGWIKGKPLRFILGHQGGRPTWIENERGCHIWTGARNDHGYAYGWDADAQRVRPVHCIRYEREVGPIPEGMELDHYVCDSGSGGCCNPFHVRPVTRRENTLRSDGISSAAASKSHCIRGHALVGDNLSPCHLKRGERACRTCLNLRGAGYRHTRRARRLAFQDWRSERELEES